MTFPTSSGMPFPTATNSVARVFVDPELSREGFTYELESGKEGTVHIDQLLSLLHVLDCDVQLMVRARPAR